MSVLTSRLGVATSIVALLMASACVGPAPNAPAAGGALVTGSIVQGATPMANAPISLMAHSGQTHKEVAQKTTDTQGRFAFEGVAPGKYTVVFKRPTAMSRSYDDNAYQPYTYESSSDTYYPPPDPQSMPMPDDMVLGYLTTFRGLVAAPAYDADTFAFLETAPFAVVTGNPAKALDPIDVTWKSDLATDSLRFRWKAAPQATGYTLRVATKDMKPVFARSGLGASATAFDWDGLDQSGKDVPEGDYVWWVTSTLSKGAVGAAVPAEVTVE